MSGWASVPHFRQTKKTEEVVMEGTGHVAGAGNHPGQRDINAVVGVTHGCFIRRYLMERTEEAGNWLYELVQGRLSDDAIVKGFLKHYALVGKTLKDAEADIDAKRWHEKDVRQQAIGQLQWALKNHANAPEPPESRTLEEIHQIVECVRAGIPIQIDYWDGEEDDPYVVKACW